MLKAAGYNFSAQPYFVHYANKEMLADKFYKQSHKRAVSSQIGLNNALTEKAAAEVN